MHACIHIFIHPIMSGRFLSLFTQNYVYLHLTPYLTHVDLSRIHAVHPSWTKLAVERLWMHVHVPEITLKHEGAISAIPDYVQPYVKSVKIQYGEEGLCRPWKTDFVPILHTGRLEFLESVKLSGCGPYFVELYAQIMHERVKVLDISETTCTISTLNLTQWSPGIKGLITSGGQIGRNQHIVAITTHYPLGWYNGRKLAFYRITTKLYAAYLLNSPEVDTLVFDYIEFNHHMDISHSKLKHVRCGYMYHSSLRHVYNNGIFSCLKTLEIGISFDDSYDCPDYNTVFDANRFPSLTSVYIIIATPLDGRRMTTTTLEPRSGLTVYITIGKNLCIEDNRIKSLDEAFGDGPLGTAQQMFDKAIHHDDPFQDDLSFHSESEDDFVYE